MNYLEEELGIKVEHVNLHRMKYTVQMWTAKMQTSGGTKFATLMANNKGRVNCVAELFKWLTGHSDHTLPAIGLGLVEYMPSGEMDRRMLKSFDKLEVQVRDMLGDDGIFLFPSHPKIAPYHNEPILFPFNFGYTGIFNALGLPVTQCPLGLSKEGIPMGIQVVSAINNDRLSIAVARQLEKGFGGWSNF